MKLSTQRRPISHSDERIVFTHEKAGTTVEGIDWTPDGQGLYLSIIEPEVRDKLFRPFFTTSEHGTGLGLYIARELCRANEATLDYVELAEGGGCFRIVLPDPRAMLPA